MNDYRAYVDNDYNSIYHHGIKGMRWGIRRYQNVDGSLTADGKTRYGDTNADDETVKKRKKERLKTGIAIAGAAALGYGLYRGGRALRDRSYAKKLVIAANRSYPKMRKQDVVRLSPKTSSLLDSIFDKKSNLYRSTIWEQQVNNAFRRGEISEIERQAGQRTIDRLLKKSKYPGIESWRYVRSNL